LAQLPDEEPWSKFKDTNARGVNIEYHIASGWRCQDAQYSSNLLLKAEYKPIQSSWMAWPLLLTSKKSGVEPTGTGMIMEKGIKTIWWANNTEEPATHSETTYVETLIMMFTQQAKVLEILQCVNNTATPYFFGSQNVLSPSTNGTNARLLNCSFSTSTGNLDNISSPYTQLLKKLLCRLPRVHHESSPTFST